MIRQPFTGYTFHGYPAEESEETMIDAKAEYETLVKAAEDVASPHLICILGSDGLHTYENITEVGDIEDLKKIATLVAVMVSDEVGFREGIQAEADFLEGLRDACS